MLSLKINIEPVMVFWSRQEKIEICKNKCEKVLADYSPPVSCPVRAFRCELDSPGEGPDRGVASIARVSVEAGRDTGGVETVRATSRVMDRTRVSHTVQCSMQQFPLRKYCQILSTLSSQAPDWTPGVVVSPGVSCVLLVTSVLSVVFSPGCWGWEWARVLKMRMSPGVEDENASLLI